MILAKGVFLAPVFSTGGYSAKMILRNTLRNPNDPLAAQKKMGIKFKSFALDAQGRVIDGSECTGTIPFDSYYVIEHPGKNAEMLAAVTEVETDGQSWFEQEHEILYAHPLTKSRPSVIYDQQPYREIPEYAPIILMNHKSYISQHVTSILMFSNYRGSTPKTSFQEMELRFFDCGGKLLKKKVYPIAYNSAHYFDIREELSGLIELSETPELITVTGRGGNSIFAIQTCILNQRTHNMAVEHSLAPPYFVSENMAAIRQRALVF